MPGKRPRQIQRTTSMSHLGAARFPQSFHSDAVPPHRGHSCPPQQEFFHASMEPCAEVGEMLDHSFSLKQNANNMAIDGSAEESLLASRPVWPYQAANSGSEALPNVHRDAQLSYLPQPFYKRAAESQTMLYRRNVETGSAHAAQPTHFLDICYLCSKLLGHGRDVFMYRGDRAFCSVECRHLQIMADERREKGVLRNAKDGAAVSAQASESPTANQVETVAAA